MSDEGGRTPPSSVSPASEPSQQRRVFWPVRRLSNPFIRLNAAVRELQKGLWWWEARHPEWTAEDEGKGMRMPAQLFSAGDRLPFGVEAFPGPEPPYDVLLWVESHRAVAIGDTFIDRGNGIELLERWLAEGVTREQVVEELRPLLERPIEYVLPTHGSPTDRAALERALA